jgi:hypothetical protein
MTRVVTLLHHLIHRLRLITKTTMTSVATFRNYLTDWLRPNRVIKGLCFSSAFIACVLLLRPASFYDMATSLWNGPTKIESNTASLDTAAPDASFTGTDNEETAPSRQNSAGQDLVRPQTEHRELTVSQNLVIEEYKKVTAEIQERIYQEQILFALKFTIIGGILLALFQLSKREDFEEFIQRRRAAVFFTAALLASVIIDVRLRFDLKVVETLGSYCTNLATQYPDMRNGWEMLFKKEMDRSVFPLMRNFSLSLTALIYSVTVYLYIILPSGAHRDTWKVVKPAAILIFVLLTIVGVSYSRQGEIGNAIASIVLGVLGLACLWVAFALKAKTAGVIEVVGKIVYRLSGDAERASEATAVRSYLQWVKRVTRPVEFVSEIVKETEGMTEKRREETIERRLREANLPESSLEAVRKGIDGLPEGKIMGRELAKELQEDADEAGFAEDYLWKFFLAHQKRLQWGHFLRYPKTF